MGRLPTKEWKVTPRGAFGFNRGDHIHTGVDLAGEPGDPVVAPEDGTIVALLARDPPEDLPQPWRGYGPGILVMRGKSGRYHVLAHLDDDDLTKRWGGWVKVKWFDPAKDIGEQVKESGAPLDLPDPLGLFDRASSAFTVKEGQIVGVIGSARHVHWEVRKSKLSGRYAPQIWANSFVWHHNPPPAVAEELKPEEGIVLITLALLAAMFLGSKSKR